MFGSSMVLDPKPIVVGIRIYAVQLSLIDPRSHNIPFDIIRRENSLHNG